MVMRPFPASAMETTYWSMSSHLPENLMLPSPEASSSVARLTVPSGMGVLPGVSLKSPMMMILLPFPSVS